MTQVPGWYRKVTLSTPSLPAWLDANTDRFPWTSMAAPAKGERSLLSNTWTLIWTSAKEWKQSVLEGISVSEARWGAEIDHLDHIISSYLACRMIFRPVILCSLTVVDLKHAQWCCHNSASMSFYWAPEWRSGLRHCISVLEMSLQFDSRLYHIQPWLGVP